MDFNAGEHQTEASTARGVPGVFDEKGDVHSAIALAVATDRIVVFPSAKEQVTSHAYLERKEAFFRQVSDVVVVVESVEATSVAISSIRHLLTGVLHGVIVAGSIDIAPLHQMALPEEKERLGDVEREGRFIAMQGASPDAVAAALIQMLNG